MKKIILILQLICLLSLSILSQEKADWKIYAPANEKFSVEVPNKLKGYQSIIDQISDDDENADAPDKKIFQYANYHLEFNGLFLNIFSVNQEYADPQKFLSEIDLDALIKANSAKRKILETSTFKGELFSFKDDEDFYHKILIIEEKERRYIFYAISPKDIDCAAERFFKSIIIDKEFRSKANITAASERKDLTADSDCENNKLAAPGSKAGNSDPAQLSNRPSSEKGPKKTNTADALEKKVPLKIQYQPKPPYTDLARTFNISGVVRLRVTFNADGSIGEVSKWSGLPLGLTKNAIEAAKAIKFQPPTLNGAPQTVVRVVEYRFTIY